MRSRFTLLAILAMVAACKADRAPPTSTAAGSADASSRAPRSAKIVVPQVKPAAARDRAVQAWKDAEQAATAERWDEAAERYGDVVKDCTAPSLECRDVAYKAALARGHAARLEGIPKPTLAGSPIPMPARTQAVADAADRFIELAGPDDPEVPGMRFLAAASYSRYGWDDTALPRFEAVLRSHPTHDVAEYAANLLLDTLNRAQRYDELRLWTKVLLADEALLAAKPQLRALLQRLISAR